MCVRMGVGGGGGEGGRPPREAPSADGGELVMGDGTRAVACMTLGQSGRDVPRLLARARAHTHAHAHARARLVDVRPSTTRTGSRVLQGCQRGFASQQTYMQAAHVPLPACLPAVPQTRALAGGPIEYIFVVESESDPAVPALYELQRQLLRQPCLDRGEHEEAHGDGAAAEQRLRHHQQDPQHTHHGAAGSTRQAQTPAHMRVCVAGLAATCSQKIHK